MVDVGGLQPVRAFIDRAAEACLAAVRGYVADHEPDVRFQRYVLFALAALDASARHPALEDADLRFLIGACSDAAAVCRTEVPEEGLVAVAACLEEVVVACSGLLGSEAIGRTQSSGWQRFLFEDADFDVARADGTWRLRRLALGAESRRFDEALAELIPTLSNHRIAEVTVVVLDWYAHADAHA